MQRPLKPFLMVNTCTRPALLTKESHTCILIVAEQVTVMDFTLERMDSEEAMMTLNVPYSVSLLCMYIILNQLSGVLCFALAEYC